MINILGFFLFPQEKISREKRMSKERKTDSDIEQYTLSVFLFMYLLCTWWGDSSHISSEFTFLPLTLSCAIAIFLSSRTQLECFLSVDRPIQIEVNTYNPTEAISTMHAGTQCLIIA